MIEIIIFGSQSKTMPLQEEFENQGNWLFKYRGTLPILILLVGVGLFVYLKFYPEEGYLEETLYETSWSYFCLFVSLFGLFIRVVTVGFTPRNTSGRNTKEQVADTVNTKGTYSIVRHPLYVGNFFMWLGPALLTENFWFIVSFVFFYMLYYERIMFAEEQYLRRKFDSTYMSWAARTPAFIPSLRNFEGSQMSFSWKKVLKNEKTGIMLTFIIFTIMHVAGQYIQEKETYDYVLIGLCVASLLYYVVIKTLSKTTNILVEEGR